MDMADKRETAEKNSAPYAARHALWVLGHWADFQGPGGKSAAPCIAAGRGLGAVAPLFESVFSA
ncbi:MAG: hypothetical protein Q4A97_07100 [Comamonadaceae bacterium]|nr:hypothetical protein [Comamonadaceae bacterium]